MELVVQEDEYGCGVACVANILEIPYHKALSLFQEPQNASWKGFFCRDIAYALAQAHKTYQYFCIKAPKPESIYNDEIIVFIKRSKKYPAGHYLARKKNIWIDPWFNFPSYPRCAGYRKRLPGIPIYTLQPKS